MSVLVYAENWDGKFKKLTFELVSYAAKVAEMLNTSVTALSVGNVENSELEKLGKFGAKKILNMGNNGLTSLDNQAYTKAIADIAQQTGAKIIILSNNNTGKALAPRLSVKLKAGIGPGVSKLPLSIEPFVVYKRAYSGNAFAHLQIDTDIKIITLAQNSFELIETSDTAVIENVPAQLDVDLVKT
ncbi:MAG: hypothetical protein JXR41_15210, partial [Bacteroidales bacterium]|nr:hypothetical protein [Bacteroidales bacterium]